MRVVARRRAGYTHEVEIEGGHTLVIDEPEEPRRHRHRPLPHPRCSPPPRRLHRDHGRDVRRPQGLGPRRGRGRGRRRATTARVPERLHRDAAGRRRSSTTSSASGCCVIAGKCPVHRALSGETDGHRSPTAVEARLTDGPRARRPGLRRHRRQPRHRPRDRAAALRRGRRVLLVARGEERLAEAAEAVSRPARGRRRAPSRWRSTSPTPTPASASSPPRASASAHLDVLVNNAGTAALARPRRGPRRGLAGGLRAQRDGAAAADAGRDPGDGRARLGPRRQRLLDRRQAALGGDARVLGREGGRALALAPLRRPLRGRRRAGQRGLPGPGRIGDVDGAGRPARPVAATLGRHPAARRRSTPPAPSARSAASPRSTRSPPRSSSSAPSAPPTSAAPPGRSTAAPSR